MSSSRFAPAALVLITIAVASLAAQQPAPQQQPATPRTPRAAAGFDPTGYWVSVVTEEWRWRMVTPPKGDYTSIPLTDEGRRVADAWDPASDGSCEAYGAAGLMRMPTRLRIAWQDDATLRVDSDAGSQTRLLNFDKAKAPDARSLQGYSIAEWQPIGGPAFVQIRAGGRGAPPPPRGGSIKSVTTNLREGWLRKNGIPYSEGTTLTEYWDRAAFPNGDVWLTVTQIVNDPKYLLADYVTSMHFKKEADGSKWKPSPCRGAEQNAANAEPRTENRTANSEREPSTENREAGTTQVDLAGSWAMANDEELLIRIDPGPELNNFTGFPINAAGRQKALTWNSTIQAVPEHQARPHPAQYSMRGPGPNFHMGEIIDPTTRQLLAYTITGLFENANRTIWLDGRPHPSEFAEHTWNGFSTGVWENGALKVTTTHMKQAFIQRNGIPSSPYGVMTEFFIRHGDRLLLVSQVDDPIYLEEPMIRTSTFKWNPGQREQPIAQVEIADELPELKPGDVPHYPLGTRHTEYADANKLPYEATLGGRETLYPEYVDKLKQMMAGAVPATVAAAMPARATRPTYAGKGDIEIVPVQGSVYMLAGAGSNITVQIGSDAVFVVDSNEAAMSDKVLAAIKTLSKSPIRYIVNTSGDPDHVSGNERLAKSAGTNVNAFLGQGARVYAHENAYARMANPKDGSAPAATALWPTDAFAGSKKTMFVTGEPIEIIHEPAAHTDGDVMVFFRKSDVVSAGDIFVTNGYPVIDAKRGGSLRGVLDALNRLIEITIPEFNAMGGTRVIPGHGRIANEIDVVEYRDMLTIIRERIALLVAQGKTLEQVKAAGVTLEYDGVYGSTTGPWTTDMFVEAAYRELRAAAPSTTSKNTTGGASAPRATASEAPRPATTPRRASNDPFDGTWALNTFKSSYVPSTLAPYRREMTLAFNGDELTHSTSTWRRTGGNDSPLLQVTYTAKLDGKEYTVPASGSKVTLKRVNPTTVERAATGDRGANETATWTLSSDRNVLTVVTKGVDAAGNAYSSTQVYERSR